MSIQIGQLAPNFTLYDTDKKEVSLKDFEGKNLLVRAHSPLEVAVKVPLRAHLSAP